jgi:Tfp pilus assembly protein PilF
MVGDAGWRAWDTSEIASALGTLEMTHGTKKAKRLFVQALRAPNDNSLAQVEWASHHMSGVSVTADQLAEASAAEARCLRAYEEGAWADVVMNGETWLSDQFFSLKAAMVSSYGAAVGLMDWRRSYDFASAGLNVHPNDVGLLNNAAYALIEMGQHSEAENLLRRIDRHELDDGTNVACLATNGLLAFRRGDVGLGREFYGRAIVRARRRRDVSSEAMATTMLAREELRARLTDWLSTLTRAIELNEQCPVPGIQTWIERLRTAT